MKKSDPRFLEILRESSFIDTEYTLEANSLSNRFKNFLKRWPKTYNFLKKFLGPDDSPGSGFSLEKSINKLFGDTLSDQIVLNLGSGTDRIHPETINVDVFAFKNVDLVADITNMPIQDEKVDGIVCDTVLEHIPDPYAALKEMSRVLKPQGALILIVPFLYPYHSSPNDFFRWTQEGVRHVLKEHNFDIQEIGVIGGPMGTLQAVLMHIFAIVFSFGSKTLYFFLIQFFMALFAPLKVLDLILMRFPYAHEAASGIYAIAKKNK